MCVINNKIDRRLHSGRFGQSSTDEHTAQVLYCSTRVLGQNYGPDHSHLRLTPADFEKFQIRTDMYS